MIYQNEDEVGTAIKASILDGTVKREDLFIVTKVNIFNYLWQNITYNYTWYVFASFGIHTIIQIMLKLV